MPTPLRCDPKLLEKDLSGQVIIVTGANSGCGLETARQLASQKATVIMACRSPERGQAAAEDVGGVFLAPMDLSSLQSVRDFVKAFQEKYTRLDVLINNACVQKIIHNRRRASMDTQLLFSSFLASTKQGHHGVSFCEN